MIYNILELLFGWACRPILLWDVIDILTIILELYVAYNIYIITKGIKKTIKDKKR